MTDFKKILIILTCLALSILWFKEKKFFSNYTEGHKLSTKQYSIAHRLSEDLPLKDINIENYKGNSFIPLSEDLPLFNAKNLLSSKSGYFEFDSILDQKRVSFKKVSMPLGDEIHIYSNQTQYFLGNLVFDEKSPTQLRFIIRPTMISPSKKSVNSSSDNPSLELLYFSGGSYYFLENELAQLPGVWLADTGLMLENPKQQKEVVQIVVNTSITTLPELFKHYLSKINPSDSEGQFCDKGPQYAPAIFYTNPKQQQAALLTQQNFLLNSKKKPFKVKLVKSTFFIKAAPAQQNYSQKNPEQYELYRKNCMRGEIKN